MTAIKTAEVRSEYYHRTKMRLEVEWEPGEAADAREDLRAAFEELLALVRDAGETS